MISKVWRLATQKHFLRLLVAIVVIGGVSLFLFPYTASAASPAPGTYEAHELQRGPSSTSFNTSGISQQVLVVPQDDILCLGVSISVSNPQVGYLHVTETLRNNCGGNTVNNIEWSWWSTIRCGNTQKQGPGNSGDLGGNVYLLPGASITVYDQTWTSVCLINGVQSYYQMMGGAGATGNYVNSSQGVAGVTSFGWKTFA